MAHYDAVVVFLNEAKSAKSKGPVRYEKFLRGAYELVLRVPPPWAATNEVLHLTVGYALQVQGYEEAGLETPASVRRGHVKAKARITRAKEFDRRIKTLNTRLKNCRDRHKKGPKQSVVRAECLKSAGTWVYDRALYKAVPSSKEGKERGRKELKRIAEDKARAAKEAQWGEWLLEGGTLVLVPEKDGKKASWYVIPPAHLRGKRGRKPKKTILGKYGKE